jgi:heme ABC exporter ATP-binding subunit CcmA
MPPGTPLVELRGVAGRVGSTTILRDVNLTVDPGEAIGLFGANGAGKTTLLRIIATLMRPAAGSGSVLGADLASADRFAVRSRIGLIGHIPALYPELTLAENLQFAARMTGASDVRVADVLAAVGLANAADRRAEACSHGMQRRAEFAREMMREPDLLLLDEPHTALDPDAVELVGHLVDSIVAGGGGAVVVSHDRARVSPMVQRTAELMSGTVR